MRGKTLSFSSYVAFLECSTDSLMSVEREVVWLLGCMECVYE